MGIMMIAGTERRRQGCSLQDGKQWGKILGDTVNLKIINFPVSFNECFGGLALFNGDPVAAAECATITDITNTNFKIYMYANNAGTGYANANIFYLFLGAQPQWGFTNNTGRPYITFPFKFSNVFTAISCICHNGSPSEANTVYNVSISGMNIGASGGGSGKYWCAFGVAQQQWGFTVFDPVDYKNVNFTLPLSVNGTFCAFSTGYDPKGSTFLWHSMSHFNNVNVGVTGFVFDSRYTFTGLGYLAVCWQKQWGMNIHGWVIFPIPFTKFRRLVTNHQGNVFMDSKARESNTLSGFTLDVADNSDQNKDAQWIAIGA